MDEGMEGWKESLALLHHLSAVTPPTHPPPHVREYQKSHTRVLEELWKTTDRKAFFFFFFLVSNPLQTAMWRIYINFYAEACEQYLLREDTIPDLRWRCRVTSVKPFCQCNYFKQSLFRRVEEKLPSLLLNINNIIDENKCLIILNCLKLSLTFLFWLFEHIICTLPQVNSFGCWYLMGLAYHKLHTLGRRTGNNYTCWQHHVLPCRAAIAREVKKPSVIMLLCSCTTAILRCRSRFSSLHLPLKPVDSPLWFAIALTYISTVLRHTEMS